jgi:hypothetical protein
MRISKTYVPPTFADLSTALRVAISRQRSNTSTPFLPTG